MLDIQEREGVLIFQVRVQPRASKDEVVGEMAGALKVRLRAPAVEDRANLGADGIPGGTFEKASGGC